MSLAMKASQARNAGGYRRGAQGDPGIFGFLGSAIKGIGKVAGFIPGIGSTIEKVTGLVGGGLQGIEGQPKTIKAATLGNMPILRQSGTSSPGLGFALPLPAGGGMLPAPSKPGTVTQTSRNMGITTVDRPPSGYHLNKSGYWSNGTDLIPGAHWVAPGTVWVKNRRTNPLNPQALSRSLRRMQGFARATKTMRSEAGKVASAVAGPRRSSGACGCKTRKR